MTREELRKKRQEIAKNNGYSEYSTRKYSQKTQPVQTEQLTKSTTTRVNEIMNTSALQQERLKQGNKSVIQSSKVQPITESKDLKKKDSSVVYGTKKIGAGLLGGLTGQVQAILTDTASQLKQGENKTKTQTALNLAQTMMLPDEVNIANSVKETGKQNIEILKDKDKNAWQKVANVGMNTVSSGLNALPFKQKTNAVIQTIGSFLKNKNTSEGVLDVNKAISKPSEAVNQSLAEQEPLQNKATQYVGNALQSVGNMIPSIATSVISKNPSARTIYNGIRC